MVILWLEGIGVTAQWALLYHVSFVARYLIDSLFNGELTLVIYGSEVQTPMHPSLDRQIDRSDI